MQLQTARQKKGQSPQEFADRCHSLAQKTIMQVDDPVLQKFHYKQAERMLLASFTARLTAPAGKYVRYNRPETISEALEIAIAVQQAEEQDHIADSLFAKEKKIRMMNKMNQKYSTFPTFYQSLITLL
jgi:hypothetical protein